MSEAFKSDGDYQPSAAALSSSRKRSATRKRHDWTDEAERLTLAKAVDKYKPWRQLGKDPGVEATWAMVGRALQPPLSVNSTRSKWNEVCAVFHEQEKLETGDNKKRSELMELVARLVEDENSWKPETSKSKEEKEKDKKGAVIRNHALGVMSPLSPAALKLEKEDAERPLEIPSDDEEQSASSLQSASGSSTRKATSRVSSASVAREFAQTKKAKLALESAKHASEQERQKRELDLREREMQLRETQMKLEFEARAREAAVREREAEAKTKEADARLQESSLLKSLVLGLVQRNANLSN